MADDHAIACPTIRTGCYPRRVQNEYTAVIEPADEGGFWAYCLEVPGANGQGETVDEVLEDLAAAIELILEVLRDDGLAQASPKARREMVRVG